ncbi:DUF7475 family protein [Halegenticoccus soli]|uniref:DUF7475 family protein n=1 Tax=Halegenticoccus soli TaxID=1985678 RepID=UPI001E44514D|nr:hypothetical protein [Halegenticoccus soli]
MATDSKISRDGNATVRDADAGTRSLTRLHYVGVVLAAVSGLIHLFLGVANLPSPLAIGFVLAGLGFFGGVALLVAGYDRRLLYVAGIPFVGVQIFGYFALNWPDVVSAVGLFDKAVQLALLAVLVALYRREA